MPKYFIQTDIKVKYRYEFEIEAESEEAAQDLAEERCFNSLQDEWEWCDMEVDGYEITEEESEEA